MASLYNTEIAEKEKSKLWYLIFLSIPLSSFDIANLVRPYELVSIAALISIFLSGKAHFRSITMLDKIVMIYAFYQVVSVLVGSSNFYESARAYRYMVLGPVLFYIIIRMIPYSVNVIKRGHFLMIGVVVMQSLYVVSLYVESGERVSGLIHDLVGYAVPYAFLTTYAFVYLMFTWKDLKSTILRLISFCAIVILGAGLVASASRGVLVPTILMLFSVTWIMRKASRRKLLAVCTGGGLIVLMLLIAFSPPKYEVEDDGLIENRRSLERIVSVGDYVADISDRIRFWSGLFDFAMESPLLGHGTAAYAFGGPVKVQEGGGHSPHHSHNMLIAALLTGGLIGLSIMMALMFTILYMITLFTGEKTSIRGLEKSLMLWAIVYFVVGLTNNVAGLLLFFMIAIIQQMIIYSDSGEMAAIDNSDISETDDNEVAASRILSTAKSHKLINLNNKSDGAK